MIQSIEDLRSAGSLPIGPVSAWPKERNNTHPLIDKPGEIKFDTATMKPGIIEMTGNLFKTGAQALAHGTTTEEIRNERYATCNACEFFIKDSKRCSECGCFMEAKTWVGGDPDMLCPKQKWTR